ncbi:MAG TPA: TlpA disulfide reductase family protein [Actinospica sp.]|nr:TlpA disulfide reductase family protein [Actinospica sp.]
MELYDLLGAAVADLPDAPDLVPEAQRMHRRRTLVMRGGALTATALLAVGAGTLTIEAPWADTAGATGAPDVTALPVPGVSDYYDLTYAARFAQIPPGDRQSAPELTGESLSGSALATLYTGHVTVLETWGSWCAPCSVDASRFEQVAEQDAAAGVVFYGIDVRDAGTAAAGFQQKYLHAIPSFQDPDGQLLATLSAFIPDDAVPSAVIVDAHGQVAATMMGTATPAELKDQIAYARETG